MMLRASARRRARLAALAALAAAASLVTFACDDKKPEVTPAPSASAVPVPVVTSAAPLPSTAVATVPLTPETFCAHVFGSVYADFQKSCTGDDKQSSGYALAAAFAEMPLEECYFVVRDGVAAGRLAFDASSAAKCLEAANSHKASQKGVHLAVPDLDELPECSAIVSAKQDLDQACRTSTECKQDLTCIGANAGNLKDKKDGVCKKIPTKAGDACDGAAFRLHDLGHRRNCGPGLACDSPDAKTPKAICRVAVVAGGACHDSDECDEGLACHAGKCDANGPASLGGACEDDADDCKDGLYCKRDKGQKLGKCANKSAAGAACSDMFECRGECRKPAGAGKAGAAGAGGGTCAAICGSG
jgi:hypothetical protein